MHEFNDKILDPPKPGADPIETILKQKFKAKILFKLIFDYIYMDMAGRKFPLVL